jgi:hypothetical protein
VASNCPSSSVTQWHTLIYFFHRFPKKSTSKYRWHPWRQVLTLR